MPESSSHHKRAKIFFALRAAFGVTGYMEANQAVDLIAKRLQE